MMDGLFMLLALSTVMGIASFLAGSLPLTFSLSQARVQLISTIGMGVLIGTALIVIIPEGVETLYSATDSNRHAHGQRSLPISELQPVNPEPRMIRIPSRDTGTMKEMWRRDEADDSDTSAFSASPGPVIPPDVNLESESEPPKTPTSPDEVHILSSPSPTPEAQMLPPETTGKNPHAWIGIALVLGFIQMYLLDNLPSLLPQPPQQHAHTFSLRELSHPSPPPEPQPVSRPFSTTLGLCIHAAADGIALGASSTSHSTKGLSLIIFFAIMVHKAPAAFGLTSVLLKQGVSKKGARGHLLLFAMAAPAGALGTWLIVRILGGGGREETAMRWWTGLLLLFSGGTFLYVAMHTMQEDDRSDRYSGDSGGMTSGLEDGLMNGYAGSREPPQRKEGKSLKLVLAAMGGMLLPLITQIGHVH